MSFSKITLDQIKNKISLSNEIEKKTRLTKKGQDYWCCCIFHEEKTPSMKINNELGSFYCFGCGAKGDIFSLYTDLYNFSFQDAVYELAQKTGIQLQKINYKQKKEINLINQIIECTTEWYQENLMLPEASNCNEYLKKRNISEKTIKRFKLGYSYNNKITLLEFLKEKSFDEKDIIKSNVVKVDRNNKLKDYFYKRLIFPIMDESSNIVAFGGRSIDGSQPKYINSPESNLFQKRSLLYNLFNAKKIARKKNNLLICEGYMDVISLFEKGIESVVSPLGTSLTEQQLNLSWKFSSKPTLMFDGDSAGKRASYKTALMALRKISANRFLQFIPLPQNEDPDSFVNKFSLNKFIEILKQPVPLINFIFNQASSAYPIRSADEKIIFDKYIDDIVETIEDKKIKFFYKNEFKTLFFEKIRKKSKITKLSKKYFNSTTTSLLNKQIYSFISSFMNHQSITIRREILKELQCFDQLDKSIKNLLVEISSEKLINKSSKEILEYIKDKSQKKLLNECLKSDVYQLFPYSSPKFDSGKALLEIKKSSENLKRRLSNLQEIDKSLNSFREDSNQLNWKELQKINKEIVEEQEF